MAGAGFASSPQPVSLSAQPDGAAAKPLSPSGGAKKKNKGVPAYMQPPFANRAEASPPADPSRRGAIGACCRLWWVERR